MSELVTVRIKPEQSIVTADGRRVGPGEMVDLPEDDAHFVIMMGAGDAVTDQTSDASTKKPKGAKSDKP